MRKIILASGSQRRKDLLEFLGLPFEVVVSDFPEEEVDFSEFTSSREYVATLASGKALMVASQFEDALIIGADTMVFLEGRPFGKPKDLDHAREMLKELRGEAHEVITSVFVIDTLTGEQNIETVTTLVTFFDFTDRELDLYISTSESLGKAGAYAIQQGAKQFVRSIEGSVSSVVGLPLLETAGLLEQLGVSIGVDVRGIEEREFSVFV